MRGILPKKKIAFLLFFIFCSVISVFSKPLFAAGSFYWQGGDLIVPENPAVSCWLEITRGRSKLGYYGMELYRDGNEWRFDLERYTRFSVLGLEQRTRIEYHLWVDQNFRPVRYTFSKEGTFGSASVSGYVENGVLINLYNNGERTVRVNLEEVEPFGYWQLLSNFRELTPTRSYQGRQFDPASFDVEEYSFQVVETSQEVTEAGPVTFYRTKVVDQGWTTHAWIRNDGAYIRGEGPFGTRMRPVGRAEALRLE